MIKRNILLRLIICFICLLLPIDINANSIQNKYKIKLDNYLESLENNFQIDDQVSICKNSKGALNLINTRIKELKRVEPYYDWKTISILLSKLNKDYCF